MQHAHVAVCMGCLRNSTKAPMAGVLLNCIHVVSLNTTSYLYSGKFPLGKLKGGAKLGYSEECKKMKIQNFLSKNSLRPELMQNYVEYEPPVLNLFHNDVLPRG